MARVTSERTRLATLAACLLATLAVSGTTSTAASASIHDEINNNNKEQNSLSSLLSASSSSSSSSLSSSTQKQQSTTEHLQEDDRSLTRELQQTLPLPSQQQQQQRTARQLKCLTLNITSPLPGMDFPTGFPQVLSWTPGCENPDDKIDIELYYHDLTMNMDVFLSSLVTGVNATDRQWTWKVPPEIPVAGVTTYPFKVAFYVSPGGHAERAIAKSKIFSITKYIPPRQPLPEIAGASLGGLALFSCFLCFFGWRFCKPGCGYVDVIQLTKEYIHRERTKKAHRKAVEAARIRREEERKRQEKKLAEAAKLSFGSWGTPSYVEPAPRPLPSVESGYVVYIGGPAIMSPEAVEAQAIKAGKYKQVQPLNQQLHDGDDFGEGGDGHFHSSDEEGDDGDDESASYGGNGGARQLSAKQRIAAARRASASPDGRLVYGDGDDYEEDINEASRALALHDPAAANGGAGGLGSSSRAAAAGGGGVGQNNNNSGLSSVDVDIGWASGLRVGQQGVLNNGIVTAGGAAAAAAASTPGGGAAATTSGAARYGAALSGKRLPPLGGSSKRYDDDDSGNMTPSMEAGGDGNSYNAGYNNSLPAGSRYGYDSSLINPNTNDDELSAVGGRAMRLELGNGGGGGGGGASQQQQQPGTAPTAYRNWQQTGATASSSNSSRKPSATQQRQVVGGGPADDFLRTALGAYDDDSGGDTGTDPFAPTSSSSNNNNNQDMPSGAAYGSNADAAAEDYNNTGAEGDQQGWSRSAFSVRQGGGGGGGGGGGSLK